MPVQEQLPDPSRVVIVNVAEGILLDVRVVQPELPFSNRPNASLICARPARIDFTSVPRNAIPASKRSSTVKSRNAFALRTSE